MERLSDTAIAILNALHTERLDYQSEYVPLIEAANRLAAYEDTGLEPEEVKRLQLYSAYGVKQAMLEEYMSIGKIDHLRELSQAEKEGRLVVLPCKVGDTIYINGSVRGTYPAKVRTFFFGNCRCIGEPSPEIQMIRTTECDVPFGEFGKTVFLSHEEAEEAQKGGNAE